MNSDQKKFASRVLTAAVTALLAGGCGLSPTTPFDPRALQQVERNGAKGTKVAEKRPLPTTMESAFLDKNGKISKPEVNDLAGPGFGTEPMVRLTLQEVIQRTVANNGEVKVAGYTPAIDQTRVIEAESRFDPTLFSNLQWERRDREVLFNTGLSSNGVETADIYTFQAGLRQNLPTGGQVELRQQTVLTESGSLGGSPSFSPRESAVYENELQLQVTQPLLRDFGLEVNRARITINRNNQKISILEFRKQLEETLADTERLYWQLVQAEREVRIQERLLQRAIDTAMILAQREDVTRAQLSQANSSVETRRAELIARRSQVRDLSDQLKRQMQDPSMPVSGPLLVIPAAPPVEEPVTFDLDEQILMAMENRFELGQQMMRVDNAAIAARVAKNNLLPQLNLAAQASLNGVNQQFRDSFADTIPDHENVSWQIGLQFEIPIGNRQARAIYGRAQLQRQQATEQYSSLIQDVTLQVKTAHRGVDTAWRQIVANRQARFAAADALAAIEQREKGGEALTPNFVQLKLDRQEQLAQAERQEAGSISDYNIAISRLELAKGTLLRYNNVLIEEESVPFVKTMGRNGR